MHGMDDHVTTTTTEAHPAPPPPGTPAGERRLVRRVDRASKSKTVHTIHIRHRDEVEPPITDWLREAYDLPPQPTTKSNSNRTRPKTARKTGRSKRKQR